MRSLFCFAAVGVIALAPSTYAKDPKKQSDGEHVISATYMVTGLH
jgi:hypothetical protein